MDCCRSHNMGSLFVNHFNPIENEIEDKDECPRPVYAKKTNFRLKLVLSPYSRDKIPDIGFVTDELRNHYL